MLLVMIMCLGCFAACDIGGDDDDVDQGQSGGNNGGDVTGGGDNEGEWWESISYDTTNLVFQMTHCSNNQELPSGCERYLAGEYTGADTKYVDDLVAARNADAYENTKVHVEYQYYSDDASTYGFSKAMIQIESDVDGASSPDMFCNFMTDLLVCSLKGCFANLYTTQEKYGTNYFDLDDSGYMADLMGSLTLSSSKIYVIASDYFIDLIRAFFVVPVNISMYNDLVSTKTGLITDLDGDGNVDINDFFIQVKPCDCEDDDPDCGTKAECAGDWTYETLVKYCSAVYQRSAGGTAESENDTLGFALGVNGLPAAGLIYTSSINIISKEWNDESGDYDYWYPSAVDNSGNELELELFNLISAIDDLMETEGILCMTGTMASNLGEKTALLGIRNKFINDQLLFGGIILVGSLEYDEYTDMKKDGSGGFGVVPVPVYKAGENYLTQIHVVGRAGAISRTVGAKFSACSAFLQYQSTHSTDIKNEYYDYNLTADTASDADGNVAMLQYIRKNVRTSFDKLFEDAIGFVYSESGIDEQDRYHSKLQNEHYEYFDNIASDYKQFYTLKKTNLESLIKEYDKLPS